MTSHLYTTPNRDAELIRRGRWQGFIVGIFALSLVLEWARGWIW